MAKSSLANFNRKIKAKAAAAAEATTRRERGSGDIVSITMRLTKEDWKRLHTVALDQNTSLQGLFIEGVSALLEGLGLAALENPTTNGKGV